MSFSDLSQKSFARMKLQKLLLDTFLPKKVQILSKLDNTLFTKLYKTFERFTKLYKTLQHITKLYNFYTFFCNALTKLGKTVHK